MCSIIGPPPRQKIFKPVHESWELVRSGNTITAGFLGSFDDSQLKALSAAMGAVNSGVEAGWYYYANTVPVDSYTDEQGESTRGNYWVIRQRFAESPLLKAGESGPSYYGDLSLRRSDCVAI